MFQLLFLESMFWEVGIRRLVDGSPQPHSPKRQLGRKTRQRGTGLVACNIRKYSYGIFLIRTCCGSSVYPVDKMTRLKLNAASDAPNAFNRSRVMIRSLDIKFLNVNLYTFEVLNIN